MFENGRTCVMDAERSGWPSTSTLKNALRGRLFAADDEVKEAVHDWLRSQPQTFFSNGIKKLTDRWAKCIKKKGDYIEK